MFIYTHIKKVYIQAYKAKFIYTHIKKVYIQAHNAKFIYKHIKQSLYTFTST